jgi:hypothetical protein
MVTQLLTYAWRAACIRASLLLYSTHWWTGAALTWRGSPASMEAPPLGCGEGGMWLTTVRGG